MFIDTHVHLNNPKFERNLERYIENARKKNVQKMIVVGFDHKTNENALKIAMQHEGLYASAGFHPTEASAITDNDFDVLKRFLARKEVVAVGECGLDFYWDKDHINEQIHVFEQQILLAKSYDLPIIVHMRDSAQKTYDVLKKHAPLKGVMHCYSGSAEMVKDFVGLGLHISLGGPVTFKNAKVPKEVAKVVPESRLLIETDAPYLAPHPYRGKQNEPSYLPLIAEAIASLRDQTIDAIANISKRNAEKLFRI